MITCASRKSPTLGRADRDYISWPVSGVASTDSADIQVEAGPWWPMAVGDGLVSAYFAGPDFASPDPAHVIAATSHTKIRISNASISITFDGGFIQLIP